MIYGPTSVLAHPVDSPFASRLALLGTWAKPPDDVAWGALALAALLLVVAASPAGPRALASLLDFASIDDLARRRRFLTVAAFVAAFLSLGYIAFYLHGGPRLDEATSYFLEGRALSHGHFAWSVPDPSASFRGRSLLFHEPDVVSGIFPPGYPLLLAMAFHAGAPMVIGPLLAAAVAAATYFATKELVLASRGEQAAHEAEAVARLAVGLSLACAALRHHTAETLPHAASALGIALAFACALRARRTRDIGSFVLAGLALGFVVATRPTSALPIAIVVLVLAFGGARRTRAVTAAALAIVPGALFLFAAYRASSGSALMSPELAYYAASDGPPGCFRYGFGADVGCLVEHADAIAQHATRGFGWSEALAGTLRRLRVHATDVANLEPLALLVLVPLFAPSRGAGTGTRTSAARLALLLVVGQVLVYLPYYFDATSAGAGARLYADVLPIEHALVALAVGTLAPRIAFARRALVTLSLVCAGFAVHAVHSHRLLLVTPIEGQAGGRPMFEPDVLREANVQHGLLYFDTEAGFNLAHDPDTLPSHGLLAVRLRGDDHDRLLYDLFGHPASHRYVFAADGSTAPFWVPPAPQGFFADETWRFEAEADWPPIAQSGGWAQPIAAPSTCASEARVLAVIPAFDSAASASVTIELPLPKPDESKWTWSLTPRVFLRGGGGKGSLEVLDAPDASARVLAHWEWTDALGVANGGDACPELAAQTIALTRSASHATSRAKLEMAWLRVRADGGPVALDRTLVKKVAAAP